LLLVACCLLLVASFLQILKLFEYTKIIKPLQNHKFILPFFSQNTHTFTIKNPHYRIYDRKYKKYNNYYTFLALYFNGWQNIVSHLLGKTFTAMPSAPLGYLPARATYPFASGGCGEIEGYILKKLSTYSLAITLPYLSVRCLIRNLSY